MKVYQAIAAVQAQMSREGISKDRKNQQQGYQFRGIDDLYNALAPALSSNGLVILPRMVKRESVERQSAKGGALFYVTVEAEFDFVAAEDGSKHTVRTFGEAMDSADKATNKAMSAAYKYAAMQAFCIPTEGDNDADSTTHEVAARQEYKQPEPKGLHPSNLKAWLEEIKKSPDMMTLKSVFEKSVKEARTFNDKVAEEILSESKDARKLELEVPA
jgi:ERF superfamily